MNQVVNPYFAKKEDLKLLKPEVYFYLTNFQDSLYAKVKYKSKAIKLLNKTSEVEYISNQKSFHVPTHLLNNIIKLLIKNNISFAVEEQAGIKLKEFSKVREEIVSRKISPTSKQLRQSLLTPFLEDNLNGTYALRSYTTTQLKILLPRILNFKERKQLSSNLTENELLVVLYNAKIVGITIWLNNNTRQKLLEMRAKIVDNFPQVFADELVVLHTPELFFTTKERIPYLVVKTKKHSIDSKYYILEEKKGELLFLRLKTSKINDLVNILDQETIVPKSKTFIDFLETEKQRSKVLDQAKFYQELKDTEIILNNKLIIEKLFPHQRVAVKWLLEQEECFLGDDMGLGKTLSVLSAFEELKHTEICDFLIVLCPNSLVLNWKSETKNWFDNLTLITLQDTKEKRLATFRQLQANLIKADGIILNYEEARLDYVYPCLQELAEKHNTLICLDESQRVKNPQSVTFKAIRQVAEKAKRKVLLSGTPAPKDFADLWAQVYLLDGGKRFGKNYYKWLEEVAELGSKWSKFTIKKFKPEIVEEYLLRFKEILLRRTKKDVIKLPPKIFSRRDLELKGDQLKRYNQIKEELLFTVASLNGKDYIKQIDNIMEQFLRAVQVASNPRLIDPTWKGDPVKFLELDEIVNELVYNNEEKIVIWTNYVANIKELVERYKKFNALPYFGEIKTTQRAEYVKDFQSAEKNSAKILIAVPAAGGVGITLTRASTAIYLDKTWNAEHWLQSIDRVYRIGQDKLVNIISLNACPIDYLISANLRKKEKMLASIMDSKIEQNTYPTRQELLEALK